MINLENLYKISKVLDVSIDYFFNGYSANNNYIADSIYILENLFEKTQNTLLHKSNICAIPRTRYTKSK